MLLNTELYCFNLTITGKIWEHYIQNRCVSEIIVSTVELGMVQIWSEYQYSEVVQFSSNLFMMWMMILVKNSPLTD